MSSRSSSLNTAARTWRTLSAPASLQNVSVPFNVVERFFGHVKQYRRVATWYDKEARTFLAFVWLAAVAIVLA